MLIKKISKSGLKMLIALILTIALISGIYFAIPKQSKTVSAATAGSSAILKGYTGYEDSGLKIDGKPMPQPTGSSWRETVFETISKLGGMISLRITTDATKIEGFTKIDNNIADETSPKELYCYYKSAGNVLDTDGDGVADAEGFDVVIYADVEKIYAPANSCCLFMGLVTGTSSNNFCESIIFDNFDTSRVTNMDYMFLGCYLTEPLDLRGFDFSSVTSANGMFYIIDLFEALTSSDSGLTKEQTKTFIELLTFEKKYHYLLSAYDIGDDDVTGAFAIMSVLIYSGSFHSIIAPNNLNGLSISLPCIYNYTDSNGNTQTTGTLVAGKTHTLTSKLPATLSSNWLAKVTTVSPLSISSIKFTSSSSAISGFTKGENVADASSYEDLYYYYKSSGSGLYNVVVYADTIIYAPDDCTMLFINQDAFEGITNCTSLVFDNFNTSKVTKMAGMFCGCSSVTNLDISGFNFDSLDTTDEEATMYILGMGAAQCGQMLGLEGENLETFVNGTNEERKQMLIDLGADEGTILQIFLMMTNFSKIIAPATIPSGLEISLPGEYNYTGGGEETTSILIAGATHTLPNASGDTAETGVVSTSIFFGLIALCFVYAGFMMFRKKKIR